MNVSDVADAHSRAIDRLDRQDVHGLDRIGRVVQMDNIFLVADFLRSDRNDQVLPADRPDDVLGREAVRTQFLRIDVDLHLTDAHRHKARERRRPRRSPAAAG